MKVEGLKRFALLAELAADDHEALAELLEEQVVAPGRRIFSEGSEADGLVLIESGRVRLKSGRAGEDEVIEAGCALGALSLVSLGVREVTARAETECVLLLLPREAFRRLVDDHPRTACHLLEAVVADLSGQLRPALDRLVG